MAHRELLTVVLPRLLRLVIHGGTEHLPLTPRAAELAQLLLEQIEAAAGQVQDVVIDHAIDHDVNHLSRALALAVTDHRGESATVPDLPEDAYRRARGVAKSMARRYNLEADDLYQDAVIAALQAQARWSPDGGASLVSFLHTRMKYSIIDIVRRDYKHMVTKPVDLQESVTELPVLIEAQPDGFDETDMSLSLQAILGDLSEADRYTLTERFLKQRRLLDLAEEWGISEGGASLRVTAALKRARAVAHGESTTTVAQQTLPPAPATTRGVDFRVRRQEQLAAEKVKPKATPQKAKTAGVRSSGGKSKRAGSPALLINEAGIPLCVWCQQPMPGVVAHRRFCSVAHRVAAHRAGKRVA